MKNYLIDRDDPPPLTGEELKRPHGKWRIAGKEVTPEEGKAAFRAKLRGKVRINIHLDKDLVAYYKSEAGTRGYQTLINAALRRDMEGADLKRELLEAMDQRIAQWATAAVNTSALAGLPVFTNMPGFTSLLGSLMVSTSAYPSWAASLYLGTDVPEERSVTKANSGAQIFELSTPVQGTA